MGSTFWFAFSGVCGAALVLLALRHRRVYLRELPLRLWERDFPDAASVARELADRTGLVATQRPAGLGWLGDFCLSPVWLFWGDLRTMRPERRLSRWRLDGALPSGRRASVQLGPDETELGVACRAHTPFWMDARKAVEAQDGLRGLHPVGASRWQAGQARLAPILARGIVRLKLEAGVLRCAAPLDERAPDPAAALGLLHELEALAALLETR